MREFSRGFEALVESYQGKEFPRADLVRFEFHKDPEHFLKLFYALKIAHLLSPDNFINVAGAVRYKPGNEGLWKLLLYYAIKPIFGHLQLIYSKKANIDERHAIFSAHMESTGEVGAKVSTCDCRVCITHRQLHRLPQIQDLFTRTTNQLSAIGIEAPRRDLSDWCVLRAEKGESIVFFEVDVLNLKRIREYLKSKEDKTLQQNLALGLLGRYEYYMCGLHK